MDVVFTYGRFNPPHMGHKMMIEEVINKASKMNKIPVVVVSHSYGFPRIVLHVLQPIISAYFEHLAFPVFVKLHEQFLIVYLVYSYCYFLGAV